MISSSTPAPTLTPTRGKRGRPSSSKVELAKDEKASKVEISEKMDLNRTKQDQAFQLPLLPNLKSGEGCRRPGPRLKYQKKRPKSLKPRKETEEKESLKIEKSQAAGEKNAGVKKRTRHETPEIKSEDESPKRCRRVVDKVNAKAEAKKPNFDNVTVERLNKKVAEGQRPFIKWLQSEGFLRQSTHCSVKDCQSKMELEQDKDDLDGCFWKCTKFTKKDQH